MPKLSRLEDRKLFLAFNAQCYVTFWSDNSCECFSEMLWLSLNVNMKPMINRFTTAIIIIIHSYSLGPHICVAKSVKINRLHIFLAAPHVTQ